MSKLDFIIIWGAIVLIILLWNNTPRKKRIRRVYRYMEDYVSNYQMLKNLIDKQYSLNQILEVLGKKNECEHMLLFYFGDTCLMYTDTTQMRQCFLYSGEQILELAEELKVQYSYAINYEYVLKMIQDVRKKTMMLGENLNYNWEEVKKNGK